MEDDHFSHKNKQNSIGKFVLKINQIKEETTLNVLKTISHTLLKNRQED